MPVTESPVSLSQGPSPGSSPPAPVPDYKPTFVDESNIVVSLWRDIKARLREPRFTVPKQYYRGEARLPLTEMRSSFRDIPSRFAALLRKPREPIGKFNYEQIEKRALLAVFCAIGGAAAAWLAYRRELAIVGLVGGFVVGEIAGILIFKTRPYPQDVWRDFQQEAGSFFNSVLVHAVALAALILPYYIRLWLHPVKPQTQITAVITVPPYVTEMPPAAKKAGGGGGGGERVPTPASKGAVPKFSRTQLAPPSTHIPIIHPQIPVQPSLLGPPQMKLPQMASNQWGDPQGVLATASNGPGTGGGIGSGTGTGIGPGSGAGLGPGEDAGFGGGYYQVGGDVTAPIAIYEPEPAYSEEARKAKFQGTVVLAIGIDTQGHVRDVRVVRALGLGLDEKAVETVRTWKFKPATRNGVPVPVQVLVEVSFRLF